MISLVEDIADRYHLVRKSGKWVGACPKCGGSARSDKFNLREDGGFKCYACDFKGDIITWLREMEGKNCPEAHEIAGKACESTSCSVIDTCRLRCHGAKPQRRMPRPLSPTAIEKPRSLPMATVKEPAGSWSAWAEALVDEAAANLKGRKNVITWLANRGIDLESATRYRLGWLPKNGKVDRASIGLPSREDGKTDLWIPAGLVIPTLNSSGKVHRLRIRRPSWLRKNFLPQLKYVWIEGSGNAPLVIMPAGKCRGAVIVEAELDAEATAAAHTEVMVIALGTVRGPIPAELKEALGKVPVILVALDADPGKGKKQGAGPEAVSDWLAEFRQARFWPVPVGKDPGEYIKDHNGDLELWVEAGLVPDLPPASHDYGVNPVSNSSGGEGQTNDSNKDSEIDLPDHNPRLLTIGDHQVSLVETKEDWQRELAAGRVVLSAGEVSRLHQVIAGDKQASLVLDIKELFPGTYVKAVRLCEGDDGTSSNQSFEKMLFG